ncbi:MAG: homoserine O-acetyltransferase [Gemmatimonadota bacterium]
MSRTLQFQDAGELTLESGDVLRGVRQAYHLDGALNDERTNLVVVLHALTGSADALGDWWSGLIGPGKALDTNRYAVLAPNLLGSCYGTTGPELGEGAFPAVTTRDQARLIGRLVDDLGVERVALVTGGSLGGMVALEWNLCHPDRAARTVVLAAPAATPASALGWHHIQRLAIQLGGVEGLALARMVGMMTFRTETEFERRFGRTPDSSGDLAMRGYLEHHGGKLVQRFSAESYLTLLGAMDTHDIGAGRGSLAAALSRLTGHVVGVGVPGDRLFSAGVVRDWTLTAGATYRVIESIRGHDAFLLETDRVGQLLREALAVPVEELSPLAWP